MKKIIILVIITTLLLLVSFMLCTIKVQIADNRKQLEAKQLRLAENTRSQLDTNVKQLADSPIVNNGKWYLLESPISLGDAQLQQQTNLMKVVAIAEKELVRNYGNNVLKQRPWRIEEFDGRYIIRGTLPKKGHEIILLGGTAEIEIGKNGEIIRCKHYK